MFLSTAKSMGTVALLSNVSKVALILKEMSIIVQMKAKEKPKKLLSILYLKF